MSDHYLFERAFIVENWDVVPRNAYQYWTVVGDYFFFEKGGRGDVERGRGGGIESNS